MPLDGFASEYRNMWREYFQQFNGNDRHILGAVTNFRPRTRGTVRLASRNPFDAPLIDPDFFGNPQDLAAAIRAANIGLRVFEYMAPYLQYSQLPVSVLLLKMISFLEPIYHFIMRLIIYFKTGSSLCTIFLWFNKPPVGMFTILGLFNSKL